jgi:hypothetical protein
LKLKNRLKLGKLIDEGAFGRVFTADAYGIIQGRYKSIVAVKTLKGTFIRLIITFINLTDKI